MVSSSPRGRLQCLTAVFLAACGQRFSSVAQDVRLQTVSDLTQQYPNIFKSGNRNAASHLWSSYILERAATLTPATIETLFRGFCPVSGSPLPDVPHTRYAEVLKRVDGSSVLGIAHHCCWPCICDEQDFTRVDTTTVQTASGKVSYDVIVIGDPCGHPDKLTQEFVDPFSEASVTLEDEAPEVQCKSGRLVGATRSDGGYVIIGIFYTGEAALAQDHYSNATEFAEMCEQRRAQGYNSGMGLIFDKVASIAVPGQHTAPAALGVIGLVGNLPQDLRFQRAGSLMRSTPTILALSGFSLLLVLFMWKRVVTTGGRPQTPSFCLSDGGRQWGNADEMQSASDLADHLADCPDNAYDAIE